MVYFVLSPCPFGVMLNAVHLALHLLAHFNVALAAVGARDDLKGDIALVKEFDHGVREDLVVVNKVKLP